MSDNAIITYDDTEKAAKAMLASGYFKDVQSASQAIVKILAGRELGFGAFASMTGVNIIQGKPTIGANLMAAAIKGTGKYNYRVVEMTDIACELEFYEAGKPVGKSRFTMDDAQKAGLNGKDNWKRYPRNMLFARAISNGQRWYCPDACNGVTVYTPDEMGATVDEDERVIDLPVPPVHDLPEQDAPMPTGPEAVSSAAPMTLEEAQDVTNRDGLRYGDIETPKLAHMANSLAKIALRSPEQETKLLAIQLIMAARREEATE
jgi:hypothetical protein